LARERERSQKLDGELTAAREKIGALAAHQRESATQAAFAVQALEQERSRSQRLDRDLAAARHKMSEVTAMGAEIVTPDAGAAGPKSPPHDAGDRASRSSGELGAPAPTIPGTVAAAAASSETPRGEQHTSSTSESKLLARAQTLVLQGNIDGARLWLERAIEM